jgi:hypothetical protein
MPWPEQHEDSRNKQKNKIGRSASRQAGVLTEIVMQSVGLYVKAAEDLRGGEGRPFL